MSTRFARGVPVPPVWVAFVIAVVAAEEVSSDRADSTGQVEIPQSLAPVSEKRPPLQAVPSERRVQERARFPRASEGDSTSADPRPMYEFYQSLNCYHRNGAGSWQDHYPSGTSVDECKQHCNSLPFGDGEGHCSMIVVRRGGECFVKDGPVVVSACEDPAPNEDTYVRTNPYLQLINGTCEDNGHDPIDSARECEAAARVLGISDQIIERGDVDGDYPAGCYFEVRDGVVLFNALSDGRGATPDRPVLCMAVFTDSLGPAPENGRPQVLHWGLALALAILMGGQLLHLWRLLDGESIRVLQQNAPEGMRTVQCGYCERMQYLQNHIRVFICWGCHAANRLSVDPGRQFHARSIELIENGGPLKKYEFRRMGQLLWHMVKEEIDEEGAPASPRASTPQAFIEVADTGPQGAGEGAADASDPNPHLLRASAAAGAGRAPPQSLQAGSASLHEDDLTDLVIDIDEPMGRVDQVTSYETGDSDSSAPSTGQGSRPSGVSVATGTQLNAWEMCGVCWDGPGCMVLLPCSHGGVCQECATRIAQNMASGGAHCPHCRADIAMLVRLNQFDGELARGVEHRVPIARVVRPRA